MPLHVLDEIEVPTTMNEMTPLLRRQTVSSLGNSSSIGCDVDDDVEEGGDKYQDDSSLSDDKGSSFYGSMATEDNSDFDGEYDGDYSMTNFRLSGHHSQWALLLMTWTPAVLLLVVLMSSSRNSNPQSSVTTVPGFQSTGFEKDTVGFATTTSILEASAADENTSSNLQTTTTLPTSNVAFLGNSMFYFNDFPNFFQTLATRNGQPVYQDSCLHGGASIPSLLKEGNAMYPQFMTPAAILTNDQNNHTIFEYGACTIPQLLLGVDDRLDDPGYAVTENDTATLGSGHNQNPCREDPAYLKYTQGKYNIMLLEVSGGGYQYCLFRSFANIRMPLLPSFTKTKLNV